MPSSRFRGAPSEEQQTKNSTVLSRPRVSLVVARGTAPRTCRCGEMVSRRSGEERAGGAGQKSGRVRREASAVRRALRRAKTVSSSSRPVDASANSGGVPPRDILLHSRGRLVGPRLPTGDELHGLSDRKDRHPHFRDRRRSRIRAQQPPAQVAERVLIR